ncbi:hypothetical protein LPA49_08995 [Pseudoalteromonas sp. MB41]|uniref:hypothetical protein n=1 Tax=Pseudoalteromonas sp. MB41 TaxID=2896366 RepID=UPI001E2AA0A4|nr:hypothetical protein [Pseudoalteromonas sp. MB41]MCC9660704.1 hypothetical protein [Pseudoalteromonas sp. MB41]
MNKSIMKEYNIINELNSKLCSFNDTKNDLHADEWNFIVGSSEFTLYHSGNMLLLGNQGDFFNELNISPDIIVKLILLNLFPKCPTSSTIREHSDFTLILFTYMQRHGIVKVSQNDLVDIFSYFIMHKVVRNMTDKSDVQIVRRLTPRSWANCYFLPTIIQRITHILHMYDIEFSSVSSMTESKGKKHLKDAIKSVSIGELTYNDWKSGKSFNNLTLDYGRHYVEFLQDFYNENYPIALALNYVDSIREDILSRAGYKVHKNTVPMIYGLLTQVNVRENPHLKTFDRKKIDFLEKEIKQEYIRFIHPILKRNFILKDASVREIAQQIGIDTKNERYHHNADIERLRNILYFLTDDEDYPELSNVVKNSNFDTSIQELEEIIARMSARVPAPELPTSSYIKQFVGEYFERNSSRDVLNFIRKVQKAGQTCIMAFTGWRRSEFGFPVSSISSKLNHDVLDQYALPYRHNIHWHIFKTQRGTSLDREITQRTYELIRSMTNFHCPLEHEPAIYSETYNIKQDPTSKNVSSNKMADACNANWYNFAQHYKPFKVLNEISLFNELRNKVPLSESEAILFKSLSAHQHSEEWSYVINNPLLSEVKKRIEKELPVVSFMQTRTDISVKKGALEQYQRYLQNKKHHLDVRVLKIYEEHLPSAIKDRIAQSSIKELREINKELTHFLYSECLYPTPHAFRHMWAEAVFRRFDGDAGWMIRSNFKHISESMWVAYIANKTDVNIHQQLKVNIASSLMKNWLRNKGVKTSGKYHTFLKRLFKNTSITSFQAADSLIDKISETDVISVKANPWGYCINRFTTTSFAKCAEDGEAKPRNAKPDLCLGCINFMTDKTNVDYIIEQSWQHIDLLRSDYVRDIPKPLVDTSISFVSNAKKRISELSPNHKILEEYNQALQTQIT